IVIGRAQARPMSTQATRSMVTNMTVAGRRLHKGQVVEAIWPPILDEDVWNAVRNELSAPRVVVTAKGHRALVSKQRARRKYLLTGGTAVCGRCGVGLVASPRSLRSGERKVLYWRSPTRTDSDG